MPINFNKEENLEIPEKKVSPSEEWAEFGKDRPKNVQETEVSKADEKNITDQIKKEIELMELDESLKAEAKKKASKIEFLGEKEKIEHLLEIAREKGVVFAVKTAREMKDPYLLDILHDILAKEGFYQTFGSGNANYNGNDDK